MPTSVSEAPAAAVADRATESEEVHGPKWYPPEEEIHGVLGGVYTLEYPGTKSFILVILG